MQVDGQALTTVDDLTRELGLQGLIELLLQASHVLELAEVIADAIATRKPLQDLTGMFDAVTAARRPNQDLERSLAAYLSVGFEVEVFAQALNRGTQGLLISKRRFC